MSSTLRAICLSIALTVIAFPGGNPVLALDTVPLKYMDVLEPNYFFRARIIDPQVDFSGTATATIQGIDIMFRNPKDMEIVYRENSGANFIYFQKDGQPILECVIKPRNAQYLTPDGEPFNSMKKVAQVELLKNIIIRGAAKDGGDKENILANIPVVTLVQNTWNSIVLEARRQSQMDGEGGDDGMGIVVFEGYILLGRSCLPISATAYANDSGIKADGFFLVWLNNVLDTN